MRGGDIAGRDAQGEGESGGADGVSTEFQELAETIQCALHAFAGGIFAHTEGLPDGTQALAAQEAEDEGLAVGLRKPGQSLVQERQQGVDFRIPFGVQGVASHGFGFALGTALFAATRLGGREGGGPVEPCGHHGIGIPVWSLSCQVSEHGLGDIPGGLRVSDHAVRGGIHEAQVPPGQFAERAL